MLWHSRHRRPQQQQPDQDGDGLTVGQRFDLVDTGIEVLSRGFNGGSKNPLNWMTGTMGMADIAISSGNAKRGDFVAAGAGFTQGNALNGAAENVARQLKEKILDFIR